MKLPSNMRRRSPWWLSRDRLTFAARYLALATVLNFVWELAQLPLYTIWARTPLRESLFAAVHCAAGDLLISAVALALAVILGGRNWPAEHFTRVSVLAVGFGVAHVVFSEWLNVEVRGSWAYTSSMPRLPWIGTGLAPLAQWLVIPMAAYFMLRGFRQTDNAGRQNNFA